MTGARGVAYFGSRILRHVVDDMQLIADLGFTDVLHTFSEDDLRHYEKQMHKIVDATHDAGLRVTIAPFGVAGMFGGEASSYLLAEHPEVRQVDPFIGPVPAACPMSNHTRDYLQGWLRSATNLGVERVFWDEPHWGFPAGTHRPCVCNSCLGRAWANPAGKPEEGLLDLLTELTAATASMRADAVICLLPKELGGTSLTDWRKVARIPGLVELSTDPYWQSAGMPVEPFVSSTTRKLVAAVQGTSVATSSWLQGFGLGLRDELETAAAIRGMQKNGVDDLWVWAFEGAGHMTSLATTEPEAVWAYLTQQLASMTIGVPQ